MTESSSSHPTQHLEPFFREKLDGWDYNSYASNSQELHSQQSQNELIAYENIVCRAVMGVQGGVMTNKCVEGCSGRHYCGGFDNFDVVDVQTINRTKRVFGCPFVNVQPYFGAVGNRTI